MFEIAPQDKAIFHALQQLGVVDGSITLVLDSAIFSGFFKKGQGFLIPREEIIPWRDAAKTRRGSARYQEGRYQEIGWLKLDADMLSHLNAADLTRMDWHGTKEGEAVKAVQLNTTGNEALRPLVSECAQSAPSYVHGDVLAIPAADFIPLLKAAYPETQWPEPSPAPSPVRGAAPQTPPRRQKRGR